MPEVFIGMGSNMGDRLAHISSAVHELKHRFVLLKVSSLYETEPVGYREQTDFLNCVVSVETDTPPHELLGILKDIEKHAGRVESFRNAPRPIDLDILLYGDQTVSEAGLEIPHPRLHERAFVLVPLVEIAPDLLHPILHKTMMELLEGLEGGKRVEKWGELPEAARS